MNDKCVIMFHQLEIKENREEKPWNWWPPKCQPCQKIDRQPIENETSTATYFKYVISSNQNHDNHGPFQHNWWYFRNCCTIDLKKYIKTNIMSIFFRQPPCWFANHLSTTQQHPAFHHWTGIFFQPLHFSNSGPTSPPVDLPSRGPKLSWRLPMPGQSIRFGMVEDGRRWGSISFSTQDDFFRKLETFRVETLRSCTNGVSVSKTSSNAEVERMCSAVQGSVAISPKLQARETISTISGSVMRSSWCLFTHRAVVSLLHRQQS